VSSCPPRNWWTRWWFTITHGSRCRAQTLTRIQPGLPLDVGHIRSRTHNFVRHGTVTLFAALNYLDGKIISRVAERHGHAEWLSFLKQIDRQTPKGMELHLIADNYGTYKHSVVKEWLAEHQRFHMHFVPTSSSWLNLVERFFRDLKRRGHQRGQLQQRARSDAGHRGLSGAT